MQVVLGSSFLEVMAMRIETTDAIQPAVLRIQHMLQKIDRLCLPPVSRRDLESILVRQVATELDRLLPWQARHGQGAAAIALQIGRAAHLTDEDLHQLKLASLLHDIGILMLPPCLHTRREWHESDAYVTIQNHPRLGATLLEPFSFLREATVMIAHHHERWDGSGYPYGIRGPFIPLGARILAVADAFEAIQVPHVRDRSLRDRIALRILQVASGIQFDPCVVDILVELSGETDTVHAREASHP
ncbi:MAG: HD domain-containing protein [Nitrospira sp.]|nr:HD domain-containing protein [Nitrospira sp.]